MVEEDNLVGTFECIGMISVLGTWRTRLLTAFPRTRLRPTRRTGLIRQLLTCLMSQTPPRSCLGVRNWLPAGPLNSTAKPFLTTLCTYVCQASSLKRFRKEWDLHWRLIYNNGISPNTQDVSPCVRHMMEKAMNRVTVQATIRVKEFRKFWVLKLGEETTG